MWFLHGAAANDKKSRHRLGILYAEGKGVERDDKKAFELFTQSAEQGYALAQYRLALCYAQGAGVKRDLVKAYGWCYVAAQSGEPDMAALLNKISHRMEPADLDAGKVRGRKLAAKYGAEKYDDELPDASRNSADEE